jgi:hypothetical protein
MEQSTSPRRQIGGLSNQYRLTPLNTRSQRQLTTQHMLSTSVFVEEAQHSWSGWSGLNCHPIKLFDSHNLIPSSVRTKRKTRVDIWFDVANGTLGLTAMLPFNYGLATRLGVS